MIEKVTAGEICHMPALPESIARCQLSCLQAFWPTANPFQNVMAPGLVQRTSSKSENLHEIWWSRAPNSYTPPGKVVFHLCNPGKENKLRADVDMPNMQSLLIRQDTEDFSSKTRSIQTVTIQHSLPLERERLRCTSEPFICSPASNSGQTLGLLHKPQ